MFQLNKQDLLTPGMVFQIGVVPDRIDVINEISGIEFDDAWREHNVVEIQALQIPLIGMAQLIVNKKATGRPKDNLDVLWMENDK